MEKRTENQSGGHIPLSVDINHNPSTRKDFWTWRTRSNGFATIVKLLVKHSPSHRLVEAYRNVTEPCVARCSDRSIGQQRGTQAAPDIMYYYYAERRNELCGQLVRPMYMPSMEQMFLFTSSTLNPFPSSGVVRRIK